MPTVHSFLALFRMLCVYYPTKTTVAHSNVEEDRMSLLTSYKDCMLNRFKKDKKEAKDRKQALKDRLAKGINIIDGIVYNMAAYDKCIDDVVYDLAGYVVHSRRNLVGSCAECWASLVTTENLPDNTYPIKFLVLRDKGGLKKVTPNMFFVISTIETMLMKHFNETGSYIRDSFERVIAKASKLTLYSICCPAHKEILVPSLIYEYIVIRFRFQAKWKKVQEVSKKNSQRHQSRKMSKL
jgi:hypothetical protein